MSDQELYDQVHTEDEPFPPKRRKRKRVIVESDDDEEEQLDPFESNFD
jgi:hypothetical protein